MTDRERKREAPGTEIVKDQIPWKGCLTEMGLPQETEGRGRWEQVHGTCDRRMRKPSHAEVRRWHLHSQPRTN